MNTPNFEQEDEEHGGEEEVFLDESDIIEEIPIDEEELPDVDGDRFSDAGDDAMEPDDSMHIFTGHSGELYTVACSPVDATLVATGGSDDRGFMWKIGEGDWACELSGMRQVPLVNVYLYLPHILSRCNL
ncbi:hypothetical protein Dimus_036534 [Dionaea muscipula]